MIMALFPAFAGVSAEPESGSPRKGKHTKGMKKVLGGLRAEFLGPRSRPCLGFVYSFVSQSSPRRRKALWEEQRHSSGFLGWSCRVQKETDRPGEASEPGLPCNHIVESRFLPPASVTSPVKWKQWYSTSRGDS